MVGDPNTGGARILAPSGNARLWYLGTESRMGESPIAESGSRYYSQYLSEGLKILATHPQRQSHFVRHSSWVVGLPQALRLPIDAAIGRLAIHTLASTAIQ